MKADMIGFSQAKALKHKVTITELAFLDALTVAIAMSWLDTKVLNDQLHGRITIDGMRRLLPLYFVDHNQFDMWRMIESLENKGMLTHETVEIEGEITMWHATTLLVYEMR